MTKANNSVNAGSNNFEYNGFQIIYFKVGLSKIVNWMAFVVEIKSNLYRFLIVLIPGYDLHFTYVDKSCCRTDQTLTSKIIY